MRRTAQFAVSLVIIISIAGCVGRTVDEELLPTPVPTLDTEALAQAAEAARPTEAPTATPTPLPPTPEPTSIPADSPEPASDEPESASESKSSTLIEYGGEVAGTQEDSTGAAENLTADETTVEATDETAGTEDVETSEVTSEASETITSTTGVDSAPPDLAASEQTSGTVSSTAPESPTADAESTPEEDRKDVTEAAEEVDPKFAGMPESMIAAMASAEPDNGEMLTLSTGCTGCHSTDPNQFMAGATWYNMAEVAVNRVDGESPGLYLYKSIVDPNAFLVDEYLPNIMLQMYGETVTEEDMADIIAYLLAIRGR